MPAPSSSSSTNPAVPPQPDHFYPSPHVRPDWRDRNNPESYIWPEEDPAASRGIPVFKPTWEDFKDFEGYVTAIEPWGRRSGIVKIIPPKEWRDALPPVARQLPSIQLRNPIAQEMIGSSGLFRQSNFEKRKTYSVREWLELCNKPENRTPSPTAAVKRDKDRSGTESPQKRGRRKVRQAEPEDEDSREEKEVEMRVGLSPYNEHDAPPTPESLPDAAPSAKVTARQEPPQQVQHPEDPFFTTFDPLTAWLPRDTKPEDYTPEACAQLERNFWRSIGNGGSAAWYGADMKGSLFTAETTSWNVSCLPNPLSRLLDLTNRKLPGVNTPYLYFGMWRAAFAWHVEDMDLYSINYIHFGAPKLWWAIPSQKAQAFERTMKGYFPVDAKRCSQFLRHKSFLVSPTVLANSSCRPNVVVQHQGEFVITFPQGYHAGINLGFNCAESVNFSLQGWEDTVRKADWCKCEKDSVKLDIDALLKEAKEIQMERQKAERRKESRSAKKRRIEEVAGEAEAVDLPQPVKKRRHRSALSSKTAKSSSASRPVPSSPAPLAKACILCPSSDEDTLLKVHDVPSFMRNMVGVQTWAHEICARVLPETWVDELEGEKWVFGVDVIEKARWDLKCAACAKPTLKSYGAKIQCTRGKCPRAYHASCAVQRNEVSYKELSEVEKQVLVSEDVSDGDAGPGAEILENGGVAPWMEAHDAGTSCTTMALERPIAMAHGTMEAGMVPERSALRVIKTIKKPVVELLCSLHNPDMRIIAKQRKDEARRKNVMALKEGDRIRIRLSSGVFEVTLLKVHEEAEKVEVLWDDRSKREIKWGSIHWAPVSDEVLAASKAKQEAKEEEALEAKLRKYQEIIRNARKHRSILPVPPSSTSSQHVNESDPNDPNDHDVTPSPSEQVSLQSISSTALSTVEAAAQVSSSVTDQSSSSPMVDEQPPYRASPYAYQAFHTYAPGYWASSTRDEYWSQRPYGGHGWFDYYGRWHEGSPPLYGYYSPQNSGRDLNVASTARGHVSTAYGYGPYFTNQFAPNAPGNLSHASLSSDGVDRMLGGTPRSEPSSVPAPVDSASSKLPPMAQDSRRSSASGLLNNTNLVPLLNTLMQNETMRHALLTIADQLPTTTNSCLPKREDD